jgi:molecular chaperone DnaK
LYEIYAHSVLSFAVLDNIEIQQDPAAENLVRVSFNVVKPGKVAFDRRSGGTHTEKIDLLSQTGPVELNWAWPSDPATGVDFRVTYRKWLTRSSREQHFDISGRSGAIDIVFLLDTTSSMDPFIDGLKKKCIDFARVIRRSGQDCRLGLIGFGDIEINEPITVYRPTDDIQLFQTRVAQLPRTDGGDLPESGVEALRRALALQYREGASVCFVHITDAECHHPQQLGTLARDLRQRSVVTYVVSQRRFQNLYAPLCVNGGKFYAIEDADFADILLGVARSIANEIGYQ